MRTALIALLTIFLASTAAADLVVPQTSASRILIPIAGETAGAFGTHFRTDISLTNFLDVEQRVALRWLPADRSGADVPLRTITIGPRSGISSADFVGSVLGQTGLGGILIFGVDAQGQFDDDAQLHATSRIWTPEPNVPNGTMSQAFPAIVYEPTISRLRWILGMRRSEQYRLNVGLVNPHPNAMAFRIRVITATGTVETRDLLLQPYSIHQEGMPGTSEPFQIIVETTDTTATAWQSWASSIDNVTGDAWSQMAFRAPSVPATP
ncbi:MAG: hypothetical protein QOJ98_2602 [Acidobacteriota bacterium]|jgi:hypothetical protein|nr:hypothetical protein [Acidobacteriota bacterium]